MTPPCSATRKARGSKPSPSSLGLPTTLDMFGFAEYGNATSTSTSTSTEGRTGGFNIEGSRRMTTRHLPDEWAMSGNYPSDPPNERGVCYLSATGRRASIISREYQMGIIDALPDGGPHGVLDEATWEEHHASQIAWAKWLVATWPS